MTNWDLKYPDMVKIGINIIDDKCSVFAFYCTTIEYHTDAVSVKDPERDPVTQGTPFPPLCFGVPA